MNTADLRRAVAQETKQSRNTVDTAVESTLKQISGALVAGNRVQLRGFGTFEVRTRPARRGFNPATGDPIQIAEKQVVHFRPSSVLASAVNT